MRRRSLGEEMDVAADGEREEEVVGKSVEMGQRKNGERVVAWHEVEHFVGKMAVGPDGAVRQHHAFASACGAAGVAEQGKVIGLLAEVADIGGLEVGKGRHVDSKGLIFYSEVGNVQDACFEFFGVFLATNNERGLGMVVDVLNLLDAELG